MAPKHILQVSELTKKVRFILENELHTVWLTGEISNFVAASSGHWYLSLKDSRSQVKCAMFRGSNRSVRIKPVNGQQVLVKARVSLYEPRGDFQLIIETMDDAGAGLLQQQFEQLKAKLNAEGLFSQATKMAVPENIKRLGVVTSPTGAAIKDILSVMKRRAPDIEVIIYPCLVQGQSAANEIAKAVHIANMRDECDLLIVGRGGGSMEDLWCFNEEIVVRTIYQSGIPVISAVGHEIDTTLSDYVADLRAPTPSAAAELVSEGNLAKSQKLHHYINRLTISSQYLLNLYQHKYSHAQQRLQALHPARQIQDKQQLVDDLHTRLARAGNQHIANKVPKTALLSQRLLANSPLATIEKQQEYIEQLTLRLKQDANNKLNQKQQQFVSLLEQLQLVSPLATIARGYSVTKNSKKQIVSNIDQVSVGEEIAIDISDGTVHAKVEAVETKFPS